MAIESKNLLVAVKSYARAEALPLDASEVYDSYEAALTYAAAANAYAGQTIKALVNGEYKSYNIQPGESGYTLKEVGLQASDITQYVQLAKASEGEEAQGIIYLEGTTGYIWNGSAYVAVMTDIEALKAQVATDIATAKSEAIEEAAAKDTALKAEVDAEIAEVQANVDTNAAAIADLDSKKAPIANPTFTGTVTLAADPNTDLEAATKQYVDRLINNLVSSAPGIVDSTHDLPASHRAGETWRVAEAGTFAGQVCEAGDLIICLADGEALADSDFMVVQANIDGAVTSAVSASTVGNVVVFDSITGKVIKDSEVSIASLQTALEDIATLQGEMAQVDGKIATAKSEAITAAEEANTALKAELDTAIKAVDDKAVQNATDIDALEERATALEEKADALESGKADKATTLAGYGIADAYTKDEVDAKVATLNSAIDTKIGTTEAEAAIATAKSEAITEATTQAASNVEDRLGDEIADVTVAEYIASQIEGIGTEAGIEAAKQAAIAASKEYTDEQISSAVLTVVKF